MRRFLMVGLATFFLGACMPLLASGLDLKLLAGETEPRIPTPDVDGFGPNPSRERILQAAAMGDDLANDEDRKILKGNESSKELLTKGEKASFGVDVMTAKHGLKKTHEPSVYWLEQGKPIPDFKDKDEAYAAVADDFVNQSRSVRTQEIEQKKAMEREKEIRFPLVELENKDKQASSNVFSFKEKDMPEVYAVLILFVLCLVFFFVAVKRHRIGQKFGGFALASRFLSSATAVGAMAYFKKRGADIDPLAYIAIVFMAFYIIRPLVLMLGKRNIASETVPCSSKNLKKNKWKKYIIMLVMGVLVSNISNHYYFGNLTNLGCCIFGTIFGISFWFVMLFLIDSIKKANIAYKQDNPSRALSYSALCALVFAAWIFSLVVAYSILPQMYCYD